MGLGDSYLTIGPPGPPSQLCRMALTCIKTGATMITIASSSLALRDLPFFPLRVLLDI